MDLPICGAEDWNVSSIFCNSDQVPVLPPCFQHLVISLSPLVFVAFGLIQLACLARNSTLKFQCLKLLTIIRLIIIGGIIISQLCVLVHSINIQKVEIISSGIIFSVLIVLAGVVICQDLSSLCSLPSLFYFWLLFLLSRAPLVFQFDYDVSKNKVVFISHFASFILTIFGMFLECFPLKFTALSISSPEDKCSHASILLYGWLDKLFWNGLKTPLSKEKIPNLSKSLSVTKILKQFNRKQSVNSSLKFKEESNDAFMDVEKVVQIKVNDSNPNSEANHKNCLFVNDECGCLISHTEPIVQKHNNNSHLSTYKNISSKLAKSFGGNFLVATILKILQDLLKFVIPQILKYLILFVKESNLGLGCGGSPWIGYFYAISIFVIGIIQSVLLQAYWKITYTVALRVRTALFSEIYKKTLSINPTARKDFTVGEIVTIMSTDAQTFKQVIPSLNMVWSMPLQIILAVYFLYQELGPSIFGGVAILVLLVPFNTFMGKKSQSVNKHQLKAKDKRIRKIYEFLNSIKIIKLYAWEKMFEERVNNHRDTEIKFLRKNAILKAMINFVFGSAPILVTLVSFAVYVSIDSKNILTPEKAFVSLTLFSMLRIPIKLFPNILTEIFRLNVSIKRVNAFLNCEDINNYVGILDQNINDIEIKEGAFAWNDGPTLLRDINLSVEKGSFHVIAGATGSGKSSLLASILGQMTLRKGKISTTNTSIAYVSQEAWIQNKTIQENILFGQELDDAFYSKVIQSCALEEDLSILPNGDQTMIGENGVNLSGGQKQRISIARAVYSNADIYLLDDCLSAVDAHVGHHLMECLLGKRGMLSNRTRIMVTHNLDVLKLADQISYMKDGTLVENNEDDVEYKKEKEFEKSEEVIESCGNRILTKQTEKNISSKQHENTKENNKSKNIQDRLKDKSIGSGSAFLSAYKMYITNFGIFNILLVLILYVINQSMVTGSSVWLTYWSDKSGNGSTIENNQTQEFNNDFYIAVYGAIGLGTAVCAFLRNLLVFVSAAKASRLVHCSLFQTIIRGKLQFFESTSSGSVISRFSSDMDSVDLTIPNHISAFLFNSFELLAVILTISLSSPVFLIPVAFILIIFYGIKVFYINTSMQLKRLESSSNAPIYAHFSETIRGLSSIKAFGHIPRFVQEFEELVSTNLKYSYYSLMCSRWLNLRSEMVAQLLVLSASLVAVINRDSFSPGWAGLIISLALSITGTFNCLLIALTNLENQATVVERIKELTEHTPQEKSWTSDKPPGKKWPEQGVVVFEKYSTGYSSEVDVLKNISFKTKLGEKLAIVGRTGAGKSSMGMAVLRILEAKKGNICIDQVDIAQLGLHELRSAVTIIPQEPILFTGSLRDNIDPEKRKTDSDIIKLLKTANLEKYIDLNIEVEEHGANFSQGEKQLVCLVRSLCRGSR